MPITETRYATAFNAFHRYLKLHFADLPSIYEELDRALGAYIEELWEDGSPKGLASYTIAAVEHFIPSSRKCLAVSWRLVAAWGALSSRHVRRP